MAKEAKQKVPDIPWTENNNALNWAFLAELEKDANYRVLFGKKDRNENTSGDTRTAVFKRIAEAIMPDFFALDPGSITDRLRARLERLKKTYQKHLHRLRQTGGGVNDGGVDENEDEQFEHYIPADGPNDLTPAAAVNLWQQIEKEFPMFPRLHKIFSRRPNVVPISITTALGPHGRKTVWYQSPDNGHVAPEAIDDSNIDPTLLAESAAQRSFGNELSNITQPTPIKASTTTTTHASAASQQQQQAISQPQPPVAGGNRLPKSSTVSREAIEKARENISKVPQKRTLVDTLIEMSEKTAKMWGDDAVQKTLLQKRTLLLEEFKLGLWTKEEYRHELCRLQGGSPLPSPKRQKRQEFSPDWEEIREGSSDD